MGNSKSKEEGESGGRQGNHDDSLPSPKRSSPKGLKSETGKSEVKSKREKHGKGLEKGGSQRDEMEDNGKGSTDSLPAEATPSKTNHLRAEQTANDESGYVSDLHLSDHETSGLMTNADMNKIMEAHLNPGANYDNKTSVAESDVMPSDEIGSSASNVTNNNNVADSDYPANNYTVPDLGHIPTNSDQSTTSNDPNNYGNNQLTHDAETVNRSLPCDPVYNEGSIDKENAHTNQDAIPVDSVIQPNTGDIHGQNDTGRENFEHKPSTQEHSSTTITPVGDVPIDNELRGTEKKMETNETPPGHETGGLQVNEDQQPGDSLTTDEKATDQSDKSEKSVAEMSETQNELAGQKILSAQDAQTRTEEDYSRKTEEGQVRSPSPEVDSHSAGSIGTDADAGIIRSDASEADHNADNVSGTTVASERTPPTNDGEKIDPVHSAVTSEAMLMDESIALPQDVIIESNDSVTCSVAEVLESKTQKSDDVDGTNVDLTDFRGQDNTAPRLVVTLASVEGPESDLNSQPVQLEVLADPNSQQVKSDNKDQVMTAPEPPQLLVTEQTLEKSLLAPGVVLRKSKRSAGSRHTSILSGQGQVAKAVAALVEEKEEEDNKNRKGAFQDEVLPGDITNINAIVEDDTGNTKLHVSALEFNLSDVKDCIKAGAKVNKVNLEFRTALHEIVLSYVFADAYNQALHHKNFCEIVRALSEASIDMNQTDLRGNTALHYVVGLKYQQETIKELLTFGCRINIGDNKKQTCLHVAVLKGDYETVQTLIELGGDANQRDAMGQSSLHLAAMGQRHADIVELLITSGANVELQDRGFRTPLHIAAKSGRLANVEVLLRHGASVMAEEGSGQTPLHLAAAKDPTEKVVDLLLKAVSEKKLQRYLNKQDAVYGDTALHMALKYRRFGNAIRLCSYSLNPNIQNNKKEIPGHIAASYPEIGIWTKLADIGTNFHIPDDSERTILEKAKRFDNGVIVSNVANLQETTITYEVPVMI